jgi:hypothetical protein
VKVTIDGAEYPAVRIGEWTYDEAAHVRRVTGLTVGQVAANVPLGDAMASLAFAVVGFIRMHVDRDPIELRSKPIDAVTVDFRDSDADEGEGPPAEGDAAAEEPAAKRSRSRRPS